LDVEGVLKENADVLEGGGLAKVLPDFVAEHQDSLNDLLLVQLVLLFVLSHVIKPSRVSFIV
jgi:hypothetical protein